MKALKIKLALGYQYDTCYREIMSPVVKKNVSWLPIRSLRIADLGFATDCSLARWMPKNFDKSVNYTPEIPSNPNLFLGIKYARKKTSV